MMATGSAPALEDTKTVVTVEDVASQLLLESINTSSSATDNECVLSITSVTTRTHHGFSLEMKMLVPTKYQSNRSKFH